MNFIQITVHLQAILLLVVELLSKDKTCINSWWTHLFILIYGICQLQWQMCTLCMWWVFLLNLLNLWMIGTKKHTMCFFKPKLCISFYFSSLVFNASCNSWAKKKHQGSKLFRTSESKFELIVQTRLKARLNWSCHKSVTIWPALILIVLESLV